MKFLSHTSMFIKNKLHEKCEKSVAKVRLWLLAVFEPIYTEFWQINRFEFRKKYGTAGTNHQTHFGNKKVFLKDIFFQISLNTVFFLVLFILFAIYHIATTANVGIQLYGEDAFSSACHLYKDGAFHRSAEDLFLVATQSSLGPIWKVCVNYKLTEHIVSVA